MLDQLQPLADSQGTEAPGRHHAAQLAFIAPLFGKAVPGDKARPGRPGVRGDHVPPDVLKPVAFPCTGRG